ncbi:hypothetical protein [Inquilinus sp. Marseille-Q2685]|uniref:hypothetical protein n=1 Tax=Inquilinus sp. Marseille-Q2685 TaxID=2866581 RepID=UPI001CE49197|nr:hypothetical protein [Inquilinus sp. Marseille-Q2685]
MQRNGLLARLAALHVRPGTRPPWWVIPVWLLFDAVGLFICGVGISALSDTSAQLAMHADVVRITTPVGFIMLFGPIFPIMHIIGLLGNWAERRRKPVIGLRQRHLWAILSVLVLAVFPLIFIANWMIGIPLRERAAAAGYIECDGIFDRLERGHAYTTYALSADQCRKAGFQRSRIEPDFDTPRPPA